MLADEGGSCSAIMLQGNAADGRPRGHRARPRGVALIRGNVVTSELDEVVDLVVAGKEALGVSG